MTELHPCFGQYVCLRDKPNDKEALLILRKLASQVKPIMRQRGWKVKTLAEFYPDEPNLLGLNVGKTDRILIRLRYPHDPRQFVPFDHTLDTLLHELSHIVWGPHDAKFHALWNELRSEAETLRSQGYSGEGFLTTGNVLGGKRISQDEARRRARTTALAAEKRREQAKRLGKTLGGQGNVSKPQNPKNLRQAMLEAAEKRRTDVTNGCASTNLNEKKKQTLVDQALSNGFKTMAEEEDANDVAIVQAYIELMEEERASQSATGENAEIVDLTQDLDSPAWIDGTEWDCPICTLRNPASYLQCEACLTEHPLPVEIGGSETSRNGQMKKRASEGGSGKKPRSEYWTCHNCTRTMGHQCWICATCGTMKLSS